MVSLFCSPFPLSTSHRRASLAQKKRGKNWGCFDVRSKNSLLALDVGAGRPTGEVKNISGEKVGRSVWEREVCAQLYSGGGLLTSRKKIGGDGKREGEEEEELPLGPDGRKRVFSSSGKKEKHLQAVSQGDSRRVRRSLWKLNFFWLGQKRSGETSVLLKKFYAGGPFKE